MTASLRPNYAGCYQAEQKVGERLDWAFDWATLFLRNSSDAIASYSVTSEIVTVDGVAENAGVVSFWVEGATAGVNAEIVCNVVTTSGRKAYETLYLYITSSGCSC